MKHLIQIETLVQKETDSAAGVQGLPATFDSLLDGTNLS